MADQSPENSKWFPRVVNKTNLAQDAEEVNLLNKGFKYCPAKKIGEKNLSVFYGNVDVVLKSDLESTFHIKYLGDQVKCRV